MTSVPNTLLPRVCSLTLSAIFFGLSFLLFCPKAYATVVPSDGDKVVIVSEDALSEADMNINRGSGGVYNTTTVASDQTMSSTSTGNSVNVAGNMTNGPITVGANFGGNGFGSYVMNTGNNAVINSGVSLSVLMQ